MNPISTAAPLEGKRKTPPGSPARDLRARWFAGIVAALWIGQVVLLLLKHGDFDTPIQFAALLLSLGIATGMALAASLGTNALGELNPWAGTLMGALYAPMSLAALAALRPSYLPDWEPALAATVAGALGGYGLTWAAPILSSGWSWAAGICGGVGGIGLVNAILHFSGDWKWVHVALTAIWTVPFAGGLTFLVGVRLGDLSLIASREMLSRRQRFQIIAEALPVPIVLTKLGTREVLFSNPQSKLQFGTASGQPDDIMEFFNHEEDGRDIALRVQQHGRLDNHEVEMRRPDGSTFWALLAARTVMFDGQKAVLSACYDISDRKAAEAALMASEVRYALIARAAQDGIWDWDIPSGKIYYSARWREIVGIEPGTRLSSLDDWLDRVHPEDAPRLRGEIDDHIAGKTGQLDTEYRIRHGNGHYCWMQCRGIALRNNKGVSIRMAGSQSDITLRKTYEINLLNAAYEDRLTGINNRAFFTQLIETRNSEAAIAGTAIILINVDQFRRLNDTLGSGVCDALLMAIARRLSARVVPQDALARFGGDEFVIWLHNLADGKGAYHFAESLLNDLTEPYALGEAELPIGLSVGVAVADLDDSRSGADLMSNARLALDRAKQGGGNRVEVFDEALLRETNTRRQLSRDLTHAERNGQIYFNYQPVVALAPDGTAPIVGFEALMRWRHPQLGAISPARFIPIAEEAGLIGPLGLHAIEQAMSQVDRWTAAGLVREGFSIAVNLSVRQISDRIGIQRLHEMFDRLSIPPGRLTLELTESLLMSDPETMAGTLQDMRKRGIDLSLDDFGTGYSSLSYLHRFPLDQLKIDRSFVSRMCRAPEAYRLVRSIVELGHDLGLKVVAEGVELVEEADRLRELGCDFAQGYFFSRPLSPEAAEAALSRGTL